MYLNINRIAKDLREANGGNSYTYIKISNLLSGFKGQSTKKEVQQLRRLLNKEFLRIDAILAKLEDA